MVDQLLSPQKPAMWILVGTIFMASVVLLTVTARVVPDPSTCMLTRFDVDQLRNDTPLRSIVQRFESGYYDSLTTGASFDARTGATMLVDEFESNNEAWLKTQIATLRVDNDRLSRALEQSDPNDVQAYHLVRTRRDLAQMRDLVPPDSIQAHAQLEELLRFVNTELATLGVQGALGEQAILMEQRNNRRIPLDDQGNPADAQQ